MRIGMALSTLQQACVCFDSALDIVPLTSRHATKNSVKDGHVMVDALHGMSLMLKAHIRNSKISQGITMWNTANKH